MRNLKLLATAVTSLLVVGCGGSDYGPPPPPQDTRTVEQREDDAASSSVAGLIAFIMAQITSATSESSEPRNINGITPHLSDTDEPAVI